MKVSFELSARDIRYFRERLKRVRTGEGARDEPRIIQGAEQLVAEAAAAEPPDFVRLRLVKLEQLIEMLRDREWRLEGGDRARILDALAYFVDPDDLIPDRVPGLGYLDDAIMVELVVQELKHEIQAYEDFCGFRESRGRRAKAQGQAQLEARRGALQARMRRRRRREREGERSRSDSSRSPIRLW